MSGELQFTSAISTLNIVGGAVLARFFDGRAPVTWQERSGPPAELADEVVRFWSDHDHNQPILRQRPHLRSKPARRMALEAGR